MPDLGNLLNSSTLTPTPSADPKSISEECHSGVCLNPDSADTVARPENLGIGSVNSRVAVNEEEVTNGNGIKNSSRLDDFGKDWAVKPKKMDLGVSKLKLLPPFPAKASKLAECRFCQKSISPEPGVSCSVRNCYGTYHITCAREKLGFRFKKEFKCPQHACYVCKGKMNLWRCVKCHLASHEKCAAFPEFVVHIRDQLGHAICWKHSEKTSADIENIIKEVFMHLHIPDTEEEFKIDPTWKDIFEKKIEPYKQIKRNVYLVKKKRDHVNTDIGCTNCKSSDTCSEDCVCRVQCISCSKACHCSEMCTNKPFRKEKKIKIVKTEKCGWGVEAAELISKGDFVIEYIGEVINDALCEERLWDMKHKGIKNFYMCEIGKNFVIDATFKGNASRFLNHSCDPNCNLEKWQVEGETRVGVFAARSIKVGEPLTYDYRFVQFGPEVKCHCGAQNCQGYLGTKRKVNAKVDLLWGSKRRRTAMALVVVRQ